MPGSREVSVRLRAEVASYIASLKAAERSTEAFGKRVDAADSRMSNLVQTAIGLGPALVPIGAVAVPAVMGLAAGLGAAVAAGGTAIVAFQGFGTALTAMNKAALEPTADNLAAAHEAMLRVSPAARSMIKDLQSARPALLGLRDAASEGLFPGLEAAFDELLRLGPEAEDILGRIAATTGALAERGAEAFAGPEWNDFFDYLGESVPVMMDRFGRATGNATHALAELFMAFDPLNRDFADGLLGASRAFDDWASGLSQTEGFQEFTDYLRTEGPRVAEALGAIGSALLDVVVAAAPFGGVLLSGLTAVAKVLGGIASSPAGPALVALASSIALVNRSLAMINAVKAAPLFAAIGTSADGTTAKMTAMQKAAVGVGAALAGLTIGAAAIREIQKATDETLPGVETLKGSLLQGQIPEGLDNIGESIRRLTDKGADEKFADFMQTPFKGLFGEAGSLRLARADVEALDEAVSGLVTEAGPERAAKALQEFARSQGLTSEETDALISQMPQYKEALASVANQAMLTGKQSADGFDKARFAAEQFKAAVEDLNAELEKRSARRDFEASIDDFRKAVKGQAEAFDINKAKGRELQEAYDNIANSISNIAQKLKGSNREEAFDRAREGVRQLAEDGKLTEGQLQRLLDKINTLDSADAKSKVTADTAQAFRQIQNATEKLNIFARTPAEAKLTANPGAALGAIGAVDAKLNALDHKQADPLVKADTSDAMYGIGAVLGALASIPRTITTTIVTKGGPHSANGNLFTAAYANGDIANGHQPELYRGGLTRVWGEPETKGEAYIPLANDGRRPRAKAIAAETVALLGGVAHFAYGGTVDKPSGGWQMLDDKRGWTNLELRLKALAERFHDLEKRSESVSEALDREKRERDELRSDIASYRSSVAGSFSGDLFGNGVEGLTTQLQADRADARAMKEALAKAKRRGLSGPLLNQLAASGDLNTAQQFAGLSREEIARRERLYRSTRKAAGSLADYAVQQKFGNQLQEQNRVVDRLQHRLHDLNQTLRNIDQRIENGARRGVGDRDRSTSQRSRAGR